MEKYSDVEFHEIPKDEECIVTAVKIGEIIGEPASTIRKWAEYHEDNLYIKKINGRFVYTQKSIKQFEFIQDLKKNKNMTHEQIRQYMEKYKFSEENEISSLINPKDPFGYEILSSALAQQTEDKLKLFMNQFMTYIEEVNERNANRIKEDIEQTVQEQIKESMKEIKKEISVTKEMNDKLDKLRLAMEERKEKNRENKGFWSKLFGK